MADSEQHLVKDVRKKVKHYLMIKTLLSYKIMRIRAKISFGSMARSEFITTHIFNSIFTSYKKFNPILLTNIQAIED